MNMKYLLCLLVALSGFVIAQETYEVPVQKDEVEESKFKSDIEARLRRDIESYLGNNRFIIQVDALIERARTVVKEDAKPAQQRQQANLPTAPKVSGNFKMPEMDSGDFQGFEELPGLPVSELPLLKENQEKFRALQAQLKTLEKERQHGSNVVIFIPRTDQVYSRSYKFVFLFRRG
jgi:flagellar motor switch protein FliG